MATARQIRQDLDKLVAAVPDLSAPSTSKFNRVTAKLATWLDLDESDIYVVWASKPGNVRKCLEQRGPRSKFEVGVVIIKSPDDLERSIRGANDLVGPGRLSRALAFVAKTKGKWAVVAVLRTAEAKQTGPLELAFPAAVIEFPPTLRAPARQLPAPTADLASSLFLDVEWLEEVTWLLEDKGGVVFYGPPGTGKTFIAQAFASHIQSDETRRALVQLHPSYGYEDFFEGYRPAADTAEPLDGLRLSKVGGPLRRLVESLENLGGPGVLVIDEMNRGNLPRVFGELFYALEYRNTPVSLMYSPQERFHLPESLCFIGTMNTADRSTALVDQALRRRFHFVPLFPGEPPVDQIMERFLASSAPSMHRVPRLLEELNRRIGDRNIAIGPSFFMREDLDDTILRRVWRYSILPTLEDHYFGDAERLAEFALDAIEEAVASAPDA